LAKVTKRVYDKEGKYIQLWHGRMSHPDFHTELYPSGARKKRTKTPTTLVTT
jgi:hypothetical protein